MCVQKPLQYTLDDGEIYIKLVGRFTGINPVVININWFCEVIDLRLKTLHAHSARDPPCIPRLVHFDLATPFVVAKGAVELCLQWFKGLYLWRWLPLTLLLPHPQSVSLASSLSRQMRTVGPPQSGDEETNIPKAGTIFYDSFN